MPRIDCGVSATLRKGAQHYSKNGFFRQTNGLTDAECPESNAAAFIEHAAGYPLGRLNHLFTLLRELRRVRGENRGEKLG